MKGILGKKVGMTSIFLDNGMQIACTVIEAGPCTVTQVKTGEIDGYEAIQIAYGEKKERKTSRGLKNHFAKSGTTPKRYIKELRNSTLEKGLGDTITCDIFERGDEVEIVGTSKGKGFQGVVKRHGFHGVGDITHGQKDKQRHSGSIGASSDPSRVFKGMKMGGRMGGDRVMVKGLSIVRVYPEKNLLLVSGSVPGHNGSIVLIQN